MSTYLVLAVLLIKSFLFYGQQLEISGQIIDSLENMPMPYVNIGIDQKGVGTVSNASGIFKIELNEKVSQKDTLVFSHIGFNSKKIPIQNLSAKVFLSPSANELEEVLVKAKAPKEKKIGRHSKGLGLTHSNFYTYYEKDVDDRLSKEKGMKFKIKKNCFINSLNFNITSNEFSSLKFRVHFYKLKEGIPTDLIVKKNILFEIKDTYLGWFSIDLKPYEIYLQKELEEVVVTIQWVESEKQDKDSKYFSISTASSPIEKAFFREKAMDVWTSSGQSMSFYMEALCN